MTVWVAIKTQQDGTVEVIGVYENMEAAVRGMTETVDRRFTITPDLISTQSGNLRCERWTVSE